MSSLFDMLKSRRMGDALFMTGMLLFLGAAYLAFWSLHSILWMELTMVAIGSTLIIVRLLFFDYRTIDDRPSSSAQKEEEPTISTRMIRFLAIGGRARPYFPIVAVLLLLFVYLYNRMLSPRQDLGNGDYVLIAIAGTLLFYNRVPARYSVERDFVLLMFVFVFVFIIIPVALYTLLIGDTDMVTESPLVHYMVSVPSVAIANLMGVPAHAEISATTGAIIVYQSSSGAWTGVGMALGCSGVYSLGIFFCAFVSFVFSSFSTIQKRIVWVLVIGFVLAWVGNLFRIALTVGAGHWWGPAALFWFHENVGLLIFLVWIALFWFLVFKYLAPPTPAKAVSAQQEGEASE